MYFKYGFELCMYVCVKFALFVTRIISIKNPIKKIIDCNK